MDHHIWPGTGTGAAAAPVQTEAERWLDIAGRLLAAKDLVGSKRFAERSVDCDPLIDGADQILAVADVLLASQRRINNHVDWYAVLQLTPPISGGGAADSTAVKRSYRRLAILLHPDRNKYSGAEAAFRLVADAFSVLSDPSKKSLFDAEIQIATSSTSKPSPPASSSSSSSFWTACTACCHVHQYARAYLNRSLRCPNCGRAFQAAELAAPPPVVPGTDMYYCVWGFFPLGFPNGPDLNSGWKPFNPVFPWRGEQPPPANQTPESSIRPGTGKTQNSRKKGTAVEPQRTAPVTRNKKTMARKKVGGSVKKRSSGGNSEPLGTNVGGEEVRGININEEVRAPESGVGMGTHEDEMVSFHIDVDATDELLGNLQNLPFLKDEEIQLRML
ncbi:uncharacterized protein [Typha angustifolia]|uniref:uncharacterized protein n=1 Tax=Typha angustifolia TaxID=59011 RepID=UPI003C2C68B5